MTKLFKNPVPSYDHQQHLQLTIDLVPQHPLAKADVEALIEKLRYNLDKGTIKPAYAIHTMSHTLADCDESICLGVGRLVEAGDEEMHKQEGTEH